MSSKSDVPVVTVDLIKEEDLPQILVIEQESFPAPWTEGMFLKELGNKYSMCLCVRINFGKKSVVGAYIIFWLVADEVHLHNLAVKKEYRRNGLAYALMETMKNIAAQNNVSQQTLEVRESNNEAIKLYRKCGFVVKGVRPLYYPETKEDALVMWADVKK